MYMRKKLDEMTVVCESFLEHLRVQSQVLVGALELTWPPAGWALCRPSRPPPHNLHFLTSPLDGELNRACGRDSKEISFLPETRHSSPSLPSTTFRSPYLPAKSHARSKCPSSVRRRYWPSKFRPRGDQGAQKHVSTTDPRIRGARFKGRSLKCDRWIGIERQQSRKELARSLLMYIVYCRAWQFSINSPAQFLSSLPGHSTRRARE